ncbi:MAG: C39 family peptidase [Brevundimonas sp.]
MRSAAILACALAATPAAAQIPAPVGGGWGAVQVTSYRDIPFRSVVRQQFDFSCGSAALATLLRHHYGRDVDEAAVFEAMYAEADHETVRRVGFSLLDMKRYLETRGYAADGFRLSFEELTRSRSPAILMLDQEGYRHFVVLKGTRDGRVLIGDPALGLRTYDRETFEAMWNGVAFMIRDPADRYDVAADWGRWAVAPLDAPPAVTSLGAFTRELPPIYQVTTTFALDSVLR